MKPPNRQPARAVITITELSGATLQIDVRYYLLAAHPNPTGAARELAQALHTALLESFPGANHTTADTDPDGDILSPSIPLGPDGSITTITPDDARIIALGERDRG